MYERIREGYETLRGVPVWKNHERQGGVIFGPFSLTAINEQSMIEMYTNRQINKILLKIGKQSSKMKLKPEMKLQ